MEEGHGGGTEVMRLRVEGCHQVLPEEEVRAGGLPLEGSCREFSSHARF